jgi:hypothetical protein
VSARADWDARFFIAIFPDGQWCKVHAFSGGKSLEKHCLSALEGLDGPPQDLALVGDVDRVDRRSERVQFDGSAVRARGIEASIDAREHFHWIRVPRVLTYHSAFGAARVTIDGRTRDAFGVLEHAFGAETRFDVAKLAPRRWRWDVLSLGGAHDDRFFAGLSIHGRGFHGVARVEKNAPLDRVSALRVNENDESQNEKWSGVMRTKRGVLRYDARAATPVSPEVDGGGFVGFTWSGSLDDVFVSGSGFGEFRSA